MKFYPRGSGPPSGTLEYREELNAQIGPFRLRFFGDEGSRFAAFSSHSAFMPDARPESFHCEIRCSTGLVELPQGRGASREPGVHWRPLDSGATEEAIFHFSSDAPPLWRLTLRADASAGELVQQQGSLAGESFRVLDTPLAEFLIARLLSVHGGIQIHGATVIWEGSAYVFFGHSTAGKSTMSALAESFGARIPTDDRTVITFENDGPHAWGTPWYGSLERKSPEGARIRGMFLLVQAEQNEVVPLSPLAAVKEMFGRLVHPRLDERAVSTMFESLERLVASVPVAILKFRPDRDAFERAVAFAEGMVEAA